VAALSVGSVLTTQPLLAFDGWEYWDRLVEQERQKSEPTAPATPAIPSSVKPRDWNGRDPRRHIAQHLEIGKLLLEQGDYAAAQRAFQLVLKLDATHRQALRLMTKAQDGLKAARRTAERRQAMLSEQAQSLADSFAREKAQALAKREAEAQAQVARAREQQLKHLYNRGRDAYRQGAFQEAVDLLQQLAVLDPEHPLVRDAQRLITRAEMKQAEERARLAARISAPARASVITELEQQLTAQRIEVDTIMQYAKIAVKEGNHEMAIELLQRVLAKDPLHKPARKMLEREQLARLEEQEESLVSRVEQDELVMMNEVMRAQLLPGMTQAQLPVTPIRTATSPSLMAQLNEPISFEFTDVALADVLEFLADATSVSVVPSPHLDLTQRRVTLKVRELPLSSALRYLTKALGLAYRVDQDAILIASAEEFANEPLETRVFFLHNGLGPLALETSAVQSNPAIAMESMRHLVEQSIPQPAGSKLVIDERTGALIVTNTAKHLGLMEQLLSQLDVTPLQVLIEARFMEVTFTDLEHLGLESVLAGNAALTKKAASGGTEGSGLELASGGGWSFGALSREDEALNVTLQGVLTGTQFESVLHVLEESKKAKTLSAPRVTTLNNQAAMIRVVEEFRYPTRYEASLIQFDINGDGDFDDAGETEFANVPQDFQQRDIGILMQVTPSVGRDGKTVTLVLVPEVSSFSQFRDLGGGVSVPEFTSSQLTTSVAIEDGQTVVLGGLMKDSTTEEITKVPWLGDLPIVGGLFRQRSESSTRKNLLIFITARILGPRGQTI